MAGHIEWRDVAIRALLADGKVDDPEIAVLRKELKSEEGTWYAEGVTFLNDLRAAYTKKARAKKEPLGESFERFFFKVVQEYVLKDGDISEHEAGWLRETLFADKKIDDVEWAFLQRINKAAKTKHSSFNTLYSECEKLRADAKEKGAAKGGGGKSGGKSGGGKSGK